MEPQVLLCALEQAEDFDLAQVGCAFFTGLPVRTVAVTAMVVKRPAAPINIYFFMASFQCKIEPIEAGSLPFSKNGDAAFDLLVDLHIYSSVQRQ
jgi:hypothetical protein